MRDLYGEGDKILTGSNLETFECDGSPLLSGCNVDDAAGDVALKLLSRDT